MQGIRSTVVVWGLFAATQLFGCNSDDDDGSQTSGGQSHGGASNSGGAATSGGSHAGGAASGGHSNNAGGSAQGGTSAHGGSANGGSAHGGSANGGSAHGGAAQAGSAGSNPMNDGGAAGDGATNGGSAGSTAAGAGGESGGAGNDVGFAAVQAIFDDRCVTCHDASKHGLPSYPSLPLTADVSRSSLVNQAGLESCGGTLVVPGDPDHSYLIHKLTDETPCEGMRMPRPFEVGPSVPLTDDQVATIRSWIAAGAKP